MTREDYENELGVIRDSTDHEGWDGGDAEMISSTTLATARTLAANLPPNGGVFPEAGGFVRFEWATENIKVKADVVGDCIMVHSQDWAGRVFGQSFDEAAPAIAMIKRMLAQ